jgi:PadR family transcriptional regulator, regulatory protein AphA
MNMPRSADPLTVEYILLGLLNHRPMHGYYLYKEVCCFEGISQVWHVKQSQLYALLEKLEKDGFLQSSLLPNENHPPRKEYHITPTGKEAFQQWMHSTVPHAREMRQEFLARLYFSLQEGPASALTLLTRQISACEEWKIKLSEQMDALPTGSTYEQMVLRFRQVQTQSMLDWLAECQSLL